MMTSAELIDRCIERHSKNEGQRFIRGSRRRKALLRAMLRYGLLKAEKAWAETEEWRVIRAHLEAR